VRRACDARAEGRTEEECISTLPARVAVACNTCNMSDRDDEEEACSGCWRAELREDRVLNDFALRPFRACRPITFPILPALSSDPSPSLDVMAARRSSAGVALCTDVLSSATGRLSY